MAADAQRGARADNGVPVNGVPVLDRMSELLDLLEHRPEGATIAEIARRLAMPRSTVYRSLNTLAAHALVRRLPDGSYRLGPRLLGLAARVTIEADAGGLVPLAQLHLDRLARAVHEVSRLSVLSDGSALVVAVAQAHGEPAVPARTGEKLPLHASAAGKTLLASRPDAEIAAFLAGPLPALTRSTISDPARLALELAEIRRSGWAADRGELVEAVHAFAAPVRDASGRVVAAVSVPFPAEAEPPRRMRIRSRVLIDTARLTASLGTLPVHAGAGGRR